MPRPITQMFLSEKPSPSSLLSAGRHLFWSSPRVSESTDLDYGPLERQQLDIYEPTDIDDGTEAVLFVHGGGWETGSKDVHKFIGRSWAGNNFIVAIPNYRLAPETTYPGQIKDLVRALAWLHNNHRAFGDSIYLAGHSAGAHMASLIGFSQQWLEETDIEVKYMRGFILLAGVYQFYPYDQADPRIKRFLGAKRYWRQAQPMNHVRKSLPPIFLSHGRADSEVSPKQSIELSNKLGELNVRNELRLEENVGHIELLLRTARGEAKFWTALKKFFDLDARDS